MATQNQKKKPPLKIFPLAESNIADVLAPQRPIATSPEAATIAAALSPGMPFIDMTGTAAPVPEVPRLLHASTTVVPEEDILSQIILPKEEEVIVEGAPAPGIPSVQDLGKEAIPGVSPMETRSIQELQSISSMLAPQVETVPLTKEDLLGGVDIGGLTPEEVSSLAATKLAQIQTKADIDTKALNFLRKSTGIDTAEELVRDKLIEEGAQGRALFQAETRKAESAREANRRRQLANYKAKIDTALTLLRSRIDTEQSRVKSLMKNTANLTKPPTLSQVTEALLLLDEDAKQPEGFQFDDATYNHLKAIASFKQ